MKKEQLHELLYQALETEAGGIQSLGWLWGISGLLLAIPILGIVNVISQHIEELQPVAELLRE